MNESLIWNAFSPAGISIPAPRPKTGGKLNRSDHPLGRFVGEVEADGRLFRLRLAGQVKMDLQHEIGTLVERDREAAREKVRIAAHRPAAQPAGFREARAVESAVVARLAALAIVLARSSGRVEEEQSVMDRFPGAWPVFDGLHPLVLRNIHRDGEVAIDVGAGSGELERLRHRDHQVRLAELPAFGEFGERGEFLRIALRHPGVDPLLDRRDLVVGEPVLSDEIAVPGRGVPGRHVAALGDGGDQRAALLHILVGQQRERPRLARPMARRAVVEHDRRDVFAKRQRLRLAIFPADNAGGGTQATAGITRNRFITFHL